mgnify:CR=1 FL=1
MTNDDVLDEFRASGALRTGHFILSSGLHSSTFLQKNLVFMHPDRCARLCKALAEKIDTLVAFFAINEKPTGSRDPYALRRAALGVWLATLIQG